MKLAILVIACIALAVSQTPPQWPNRFQQDFVQSYTTTQFHDVGKIWYEADRNRQRIDRNNGKYNKFCADIETVNTPCVQLVVNSKRWFYFPLVKKCCFCCDQAHGCGILNRNWLGNAKFVGKEDLSGQSFNKFVDADAQIEYWETSDSRRIPRRQIELRTVTKDYIMNTYSEEYIADSIFSVPSYCSESNVCPGNCAKFR